MTTLLNFFDKNGGDVVDTDKWGPLGVNFSAGGSPGHTGPPGPQGQPGPTGPQ
jgi:hypothetical protein